MILLAPTAAIIGAAICTPLLVLLYLLKLRRRPVRVSTIAFWEQAEKDLQANVPLRWIRPTWILLIQLLAAGLIILALGRPAASWAWLPGLGTRGRAILLIDNSASMNAKDGPGAATRLQEAKERALATVEQLARTQGQSVAVVSFAGEPAARTRFTGSRGLLRDAIAAIEPTDQPADLSAALKLIEALAAGGEDERSRREPLGVIVYSDGSFRPGAPGAFAGLSVRLERVGPAPGDDRDNLGIVALAARRDDADPATIRIFARVQNAGREARSTPVTLSLDGIIQSRVALDVPGQPSSPGSPAPAGGTGDAGQDQVTLGTASLTLDLDAPKGGVAMVSLGREDLLEGDNAAAVVLAPASRPSILLLRAGPSGASDWMLEGVLRELRPRRLDLRPAPSGQGPAPDLAGYDLVVLDGPVDGVAPGPVPTLSFGAAPKIPGVTLGPAPAAGSAGSPLLWERTHPILRDVALDSLFVSRLRHLSIDPTTLGPGGRRTELARGRADAMLALVEADGVRHLVAPFDLADSNWPLQASFPIFLAQAVDWLTLRAESSLGRGFTTSQACRVALGPGTGPVRFDGPIEINADAPADAEASLGIIARAGVYTSRSPRAKDTVIAVNLLDEVESALATSDQLRVGATAALTPAEAGQRELWPLCVMAAGALLILEWLLYAWRMRV